MATPTTTKQFFIRLVKLEGYEQLMKNTMDDLHPGIFIDNSIEGILCVEHNGEGDDPNPHYHFCVTYTEPIKVDTLRKKLRGIFDKDKGNGHMSIKTWDGTDGPLSYMFHEKGVETPIILRHGYTDDDISRFIELDQEVQQRRLLKEKQTPFNQTLAWMIHQDQANNNYPCCFDVYRHYVELLLSKGMLYPGKHKMKQVLDTLYLTYHQRLGREEAYMSALEKLFSEV